MEDKPRKSTSTLLMDQAALGLFVWLMALHIVPDLVEMWQVPISGVEILYAATGLGLAVPLLGWAFSIWRGR